MKRRLFNVLAAVSLLLALAVAGLWARSVWIHTDVLGQRDTWVLASSAGRIHVVYTSGYWDRSREGLRLRSYETRPTDWNACNYEYGTGMEKYFYAIVADWLLILVFSVLPALRLVTRLRFRNTVGHCSICDYDLRGSSGPTCPECGAAISAKVD